MSHLYSLSTFGLQPWTGMIRNKLTWKLSPENWSIGQLYIHLMQDSYFYIDQLKYCILHPGNEQEEAMPAAKKMFANERFPDQRIKGAPSNALIPQPESKEWLFLQMKSLKAAIDQVVILVADNPVTGKTKHPGLGYFDAREWLHFMSMHFRHHEKQLERLDEFYQNRV